jgi:2-(1,2-epoxy-1,2-dihydrophenyl)acetyl-CoA isomerase
VSKEPVLLSFERDGVRTLTLNRPDRKNAINAQLWIELADALRAAARDDLRALVITGARGAFCSGADISTAEDIHPKDKLRRLTEVALALHELTVPSIAKVAAVAVDLGGSWLLPKLVGLQQAKRLVQLAETIDADEARSIGLVTWVKPTAEIDAFVADLAGRLDDGANATLREALANEARAQPGNFATADSVEAYAAFAEKREPAFTGRWAVPRSE